MVVGKAVNMANMMNVPVLGLVENMAYVECPHCGEKIYPYGPSRLAETAEAFDVEALGQLPMDAALAEACDKGAFESALPRGPAARRRGGRRAHRRVHGRAARSGRVAWRAVREEPSRVARPRGGARRGGRRARPRALRRVRGRRRGVRPRRRHRGRGGRDVRRGARSCPPRAGRTILATGKRPLQLLQRTARLGALQRPGLRRGGLRTPLWRGRARLLRGVRPRLGRGGGRAPLPALAPGGPRCARFCSPGRKGRASFWRPRARSRGVERAGDGWRVAYEGAGDGRVAARARGALGRPGARRSFARWAMPARRLSRAVRARMRGAGRRDARRPGRPTGTRERAAAKGWLGGGARDGRGALSQLWALGDRGV